MSLWRIAIALIVDTLETSSVSVGPYHILNMCLPGLRRVMAMRCTSGAVSQAQRAGTCPDLGNTAKTSESRAPGARGLDH